MQAGDDLHWRVSCDIHCLPSFDSKVAPPEIDIRLYGLSAPGDSLESCMGNHPPVYADSTFDLSKLLFHGHGCLDLQELNPQFETGYVYVTALVHEPASGGLNPIIIVHEYGYVLDVRLVCLVIAKDKQFGYLQPCCFVLVLVLHNSSAAFINARLVCIHLHEAFVQLYYHLRSSHRIRFPHDRPLQTVHQALVRHPGLHIRGQGYTAGEIVHLDKLLVELLGRLAAHSLPIWKADDARLTVTDVIQSATEECDT